MMIVLISLLAGLGVASANAADAPVLTGGGGRQTPRVANGTSGFSSSNATSTPLPSPSPIQTTTPLSTTPGTPSSTTGTLGSADPTPAQSTEQADNQASHIVHFDPADGSKPTQVTVKTGTLATPPQHNPQRPGFRFDGWTLDNQSFDFQTPILQDTTLKARWTKVTDWTLSPDHGPATGTHLTISPPDRQEPYYTSIQAAGNQVVGLTGDGRIYTWTQDSTPKQVPSPAQAPEGFHYLQAAAGSRRQAALGSDQHIYTWNSLETTPTILATGQDGGFTSISMHGDRLLAVDRQGQIHAFQTSQTDSQSQNSKHIQQTATSLPGQAQAVLAVASSNRILALDSDGQAWTWGAGNTEKAEPTRVKQDHAMRFTQAHALDQGFLLLDAEDQTYHLADSVTSPTALRLPDGAYTSQITANGRQALLTGKDGRIWAWKPGNTPVRADKGVQAYTQAASISNRITAIGTQGSMFTWSLDPQVNPGEPAKLDTVPAPTLESASMDSQPLKLTKIDNSWQIDIPAHTPGPTAILIAGRQDNQPFTRSLKYTVDQKLTRDTETETGYTVHFNTDGGSPEPEDQIVSIPYGRVQRPSPDPTRDGYQFDGWFIGEVAYDFSTPATKNLILTAKWTRQDPNDKWSINPNKGSQLGNESTIITPPGSHSGVKFNQVSNGYGEQSLAVGSDGNAYAWGYNYYGQLGDGTTTSRTTPVIVRQPDTKTYPDRPADFTYVQVSAGGNHSLALGSDGYVYAWGRNNYGQLGNNSSNDSKVPVRVRDPANPTDASKGLKAIQVSAGSSHSLALDAQGNIWTWGSNNWNVLGKNAVNSSSSFPVRICDPAQPNDKTKGLKATLVSTGYVNSSALDLNGNIWVWGANDYGQLGNGTSASGGSSTVPVRVRDPASPYDTSKGLQATQMSTHGNHTLAVGSDGYAYAWGYNGDGQLGNGTTSDFSVPVHVRDPASPNDKSKGLKATQVSAGTWSSLAIDTNGYAWAWGRNSYRQLGNNSNSYNSSVPVHVRDPASPNDTSKGLQATQVSGGQYHSLAMGMDGNAYAWGRNNYGQLGNNSYRDSTVPVPVSFNLALVITGVRFDQTPASGLTRGDGSSVSVLTPAHQPGTVTVSVDYTLGSAPQTPDTSLRYTYLPAGVLPCAGGEGILLALATGMTGMGGVLASRRHRKETRQLSHASHE